MKIILLRHEERYSDIGFYSNLTDKGVINSCLLGNTLNKYDIDIVFSSPFIRTLQTIYPFIIKNNYQKKVNCEYALYEYIHNPYFLLGNWYHDISDIEDNDLVEIINPDYKSIIQKSDFQILENEIQLENRIRPFFDYLLKTYPNKTILLVSHKGVINKIKDMYVEKTDLNNDYEMGELEVFSI
jgi:broad specificity phosphatase PhoE